MYHKRMIGTIVFLLFFSLAVLKLDHSYAYLGQMIFTVSLVFYLGLRQGLYYYRLKALKTLIFVVIMIFLGSYLALYTYMASNDLEKSHNDRIDLVERLSETEDPIIYLTRIHELESLDEHIDATEEKHIIFTFITVGFIIFMIVAGYVIYHKQQTTDLNAKKY